MAIKTEKQLTSNKHYALALLEQAHKNGIDTNELIAKANIATEQLYRQNCRIDTDKIATLVQLMWRALKDENLGLSRYKCPPGTFNMMGQLTIHQPNLEKALTLGIKFYNKYIQGYKLSLVSDDDYILIKLDQEDLHLDQEHMLTELTLMAWHRYSSWLIDENIPIHQTHFCFDKPKHADEYKFIFPSQHRFLQPYSGFSIHKHYLLRPNVQNETTLKTFMSRCPSAFFLKHDADKSISAQIRQIITHQLSTGLPSIENIASELAMTTQTMRRKLKMEGTSYQQIKDLVRRDQALYCLSQLNLPIAEVATLTGFSEASVFIRAFKKWTGTSPNAYRNSPASKKATSKIGLLKNNN